MLDPFNQFLDIQELFDLLIALLGRKDISNLARTNHKLYRLCTPLLFRNLESLPWNLDGAAYHVFKVLSSSALGRDALARNVQHIRKLTLGVDELAYFYNCMLTFQEVNHSHTGGSTPATRPTWLPPPDTDTRQLVALSPMTSLSRLVVSMGKSFNRPYTLPSVRSRRATLAQLSWLISLHPGLISLDLFETPIVDIRGGRLLSGILSGMYNLKLLRVDVHCWCEDWFALCSLLFFSCPPSLEQLFMDFFDASNSDTIIQGWNGYGQEDEEEVDKGVTVARKREPLTNMKWLRLHGMFGFYWNATFDRSMFAHCPNVKRLEISSMFGHDNINTIGDFIGKDCPKIESIKCSSFDSKDYGLLAFRILNSLPEQQVTYLEYNGILFNSNSTTVTLAVQRHSTTLRDIHLVGIDCFAEISVSAILRGCCNLDILYLPFNQLEGFYTTLDDVLEHPWGCNKLTQLTIAVSGCELPFQPGVQPYYLRPVPITLTTRESQHFARLGDLYRRIGALTRLQDMNIIIVPFDNIENVGEVDVDRMDDAMSFPAMLNLADTETGRPGYLHHFAGLRHLKKLRGSVCANTAETKVTMGWPEATWMDKHWPRLEQAWFFGKPGEVTEPFKWLQDQHKDRRVDQWTAL